MRGLLPLLVLFLVARSVKASPGTTAPKPAPVPKTPTTPTRLPPPPIGTQGLVTFDRDLAVSFPVTLTASGWTLDDASKVARIRERFGPNATGTVKGRSVLATSFAQKVVFTGSNVLEERL